MSSQKPVYATGQHGLKIPMNRKARRVRAAEIRKDAREARRPEDKAALREIARLVQAGPHR